MMQKDIQVNLNNEQLLRVKEKIGRKRRKRDNNKEQV